MVNRCWWNGLDYIKVLKDQRRSFQVVGRGENSAKRCEEITGCSVFRGGLDQFLDSQSNCASHGIITVGVEVVSSRKKTNSVWSKKYIS